MLFYDWLKISQVKLKRIGSVPIQSSLNIWVWKNIMIFTKFLTIFILNSPLVAKAIIGGQTVHEPHEFPWIVQITSFINE